MIEHFHNEWGKPGMDKNTEGPEISEVKISTSQIKQE